VPVRELLSNAEKLLEADYKFDPSKARRTFRIIMSDYCASVLLPPLTVMLRREAPGIRCEIEQLTDRAIDWLISGDADMCISARDLRLLDATADEQMFRRKELFTDRFVCAVAADHPEARDELDRETFLRCPHVSVRFGEGTLSIHEHTMRSLGLDVDIAVVTPTFDTLLMILPGTSLIATIPQRFALRFAAALQLKLFPCPVAIPDLVETLFWHHRLDHEKGHNWLRNIISTISAGL